MHVLLHVEAQGLNKRHQLSVAHQNCRNCFNDKKASYDCAINNSETSSCRGEVIGTGKSSQRIVHESHVSL